MYNILNNKLSDMKMKLPFYNINIIQIIFNDPNAKIIIENYLYQNI